MNIQRSVTNKTLKLPQGFTIVELIIVIVVIAILATVVVLAWGNVTKDAIEVSIRSDLENATSALELDRQHNNNYPLDQNAVNGGKGLQFSKDNVITYAVKPYGYCVTASNPKTDKAFMVRSIDGDTKIVEGNCQPTATLLAGSVNQTGFADGAGSDARFNQADSPGIAVTRAGDIYVSDFNNNRIRKITPSGEVSTFAGTGGSGCVEGTTETAQIGHPVGIAWDDARSTLYFMGCSGSRLFKVTPDGAVTVVAGWTYSPSTWCNGVGTAAGFYWSRGLTIDTDGMLYVLATELARVCKVNPDTGVVSVLAGSGSAGFADDTGANAKFNWPRAGAIDQDGSVLVLDSRNNRIRKVSQTGVVTTFAGSGNSSGTADGVGTAADLVYDNGVYALYPQAIAIDKNGTIVTITNGSALRTITPDGTVKTVAWPYGSTGVPISITFSSGGILYGLTKAGISKIIL